MERTPLADSRAELLKLARIVPATRAAVLREVEWGGHAKASHAEAALARARRRELRRRAGEADRQGAEGWERPWRVITSDSL